MLVGTWSGWGGVVHGNTPSASAASTLDALVHVILHRLCSSPSLRLQVVVEAVCFLDIYRVALVHVTLEFPTRKHDLSQLNLNLETQSVTVRSEISFIIFFACTSSSFASILRQMPNLFLFLLAVGERISQLHDQEICSCSCGPLQPRFQRVNLNWYL